jgi:hypothetical protein
MVSTASYDSGTAAGRGLPRWPSRATSNANENDRSVTPEYIAAGLDELETFANAGVLVAA